VVDRGAGPKGIALGNQHFLIKLSETGNSLFHTFLNVRMGEGTPVCASWTSTIGYSLGTEQCVHRRDQHRPPVKRVSGNTQTVTRPSLTHRSVTVRSSACTRPSQCTREVYGSRSVASGCTWKGIVGRYIPPGYHPWYSREAYIPPGTHPGRHSWVYTHLFSASFSLSERFIPEHRGLHGVWDRNNSRESGE